MPMETKHELHSSTDIVQSFEPGSELKGTLEVYDWFLHYVYRKTKHELPFQYGHKPVSELKGTLEVYDRFFHYVYGKTKHELPF